jgi:hypothetical protein
MQESMREKKKYRILFTGPDGILVTGPQTRYLGISALQCADFAPGHLLMQNRRPSAIRESMKVGREPRSHFYS